MARRQLFAGLVMILMLVSCGRPAPTTTAMATTSPLLADWRISTPEEQRVDSAVLDEMMRFILDEELDIDSVVVVRHGHIVLEEYLDEPSTQDRVKRLYIHKLYSVTKSITSALIGIAIQEGFIDSVDQKVVDFFPDRDIANLDSRKQNLTLEHLLTMQCGFEWEGPDIPGGTWDTVFNSSDAIQSILDLPMATDPGTEWYYNGGCSHLLSAIITETTGRSTRDFALQYLFGPLGIAKQYVYWPQDRQGIYLGGQDIALTALDMAKIGQLFLNNGVWNGQQIIAADWVSKSTDTYHYFSDDAGYGYQWWTYPKSGIYYADGWKGQKICIVPNLDLVFVLTGTIEDPLLESLEPLLLRRFVLPACDDYTPPDNRYDKYGFSFEYPPGSLIIEQGLWWDGAASEASGQVQAVLWPEVFVLAWDTPESTPDLEAYLEQYFETLSRSGIEINERGPMLEMTRGDYEMIYQYATVTEDDRQYSLVTGDWYCDESRRVFMPLYVGNVRAVSEPDSLLTGFQRYLDTLVCHP